MKPSDTTAAVQLYVDELKGHSRSVSAAPVVRELLAGAAERLHTLCTSLLYRSYPRLARPPVNLRSDDLLGAVVECLIKALRDARPGNVRQFFALANQHMRWELNDLARRLDEHTQPVVLEEEHVADRTAGESRLSANARRILAALDSLSEDEREVFGLVRIQGLTHGEASEVLGVATKTIQRRLNRCRVQLATLLRDLDPQGGPAVDTADA